MGSLVSKSSKDIQEIKIFKLSFFIVACTTLVFYTNLFDPFNSPKLWVLTLGASWLLGWLIYFLRNWKLQNNREWFEDKVVQLTLFFLFSNLLALFFSEVKYTAFFGENLRRNGMLSYVSVSILFLIVYRTFNLSVLKFFYRGLFFVAVLEGTYGFTQHLGKDFIKWQNQYNPIIGTVGNPNFSAALMSIFAVLLITGVSIDSFNKVFKIMMLLLGSFLVVVIYFSDAKQGLLSFIIGIGTFSVLYCKKLGKQFFYSALLGFSLVLILGILGILQKGPLAEALYKPSVSLRGFYWRAGLNMFTNNLITGIGLDNYADYFRLYREPEFAFRQGFQLTSSNAHNVFIQQFATGGLFLGMSYLFIVVFIFYKVLKSINNQNSNIRMSLFAGWIAFQSQSMVSIDNLGLSVWGWFLGAILLKLCLTHPNDNGTTNRVTRNIRQKISGIQLSVSTLSLILVFVIVSNLYGVETKMLHIRKSQASNNSAYLAELRNVAANPFTEPSFKFQIALTLGNLGLIDDSRGILNNLMNQDSVNTEYRTFSAQIYEAQGNIQKALEERIKVRKFDPWNLNNLMVIAGYYEKLNDLSNAKSIYDFVSQTKANQPEVKQANEALARLN